MGRIIIIAILPFLFSCTTGKQAYTSKPSKTTQYVSGQPLQLEGCYVSTDVYTNSGQQYRSASAFFLYENGTARHLDLGEMAAERYDSLYGHKGEVAWVEAMMEAGTDLEDGGYTLKDGKINIQVLRNSQQLTNYDGNILNDATIWIETGREIKNDKKIVDDRYLNFLQMERPAPHKKRWHRKK